MGLRPEKGVGVANARCFRAIEGEVYAYAVQLPRFTVFCQRFALPCRIDPLN